MRMLATRWDQFWFRPVSVRRLAVVRIVTVGIVLFDLLADTTGSRQLATAGAEFWNPNELALVRELHLPRTSAELWTALWLILCVCAVLALVGFYTRAALVVLAAGYAWWVMTSLSYANVGHGRLISIVSLSALAIAPSGAAYSIDGLVARARQAIPSAPLAAAVDRRDALAGWAIRFIGVVLVLTYMSAAYSKFRASGIDWAFDGAMDAALVEQGSWLGDIAGNHPALVHLMAASAHLWEATAFLALTRGRARNAWVLFGVGFHLGSLLLLEVNFTDFPAAYVVFFDVERATSRAGAWLREWAHGRFEQIEVRYDGQCGFCIRAMTFLKGMDTLDLLVPVDGTSPDGARLETFAARDGSVLYEGFAAYRRMARSVPLLMPMVPLLHLPPVAHVGQRVYTRVAAGRGTSCTVPIRKTSQPVRRTLR